MEMKKILAGFFQAQGEICKTGETEFRGILSPKGADQAGFLREQRGAAGRELDGDWLLMTQPGIPGLEKGAVMECGGKQYSVRFAEDYLLADEPIYRQAVLRRRVEGGGAGDGE